MPMFSRSFSLHPCAFLFGLLALLPATAGAQDTTGPVTEAGAPHLPADSLQLGATYIEWMLDYRADSLWAHLGDGMRENFGSVGGLKDGLGDVFRQIGDHKRMISQRYWMRDGKPQFWYTAEYSAIPEPVVIRFVIEPDGMISGLGINPQSRNPAVDDPTQHGAEVDPAGD